MSPSEADPARKPRSKASRNTVASGKPAEAATEWAKTIAGLSYHQARTAMDLAIAQLQSDDLEVEQMADLYRRALACAERCEQVLAAVEQEVIQLDPESLNPGSLNPLSSPHTSS
ncbi:MAG: exodeoxyribonuclease VII small subunit [Prochlorococcaceae cyanobacterium]